MTIFANRSWRLGLAVLVALAAMGSSASAETLLAAATRSGNISGSGGRFIALTNGGATALAFITTTSLIKITYNAECGSVGSSGWTTVRIFVDGIEASPASGTSFALCTAEGSSFHWVGAVRQSLIARPTGGHRVQVWVQNIAGATSWWLGDSSIVVEQR